VPLPARRFLIFGALIAACSSIGAAVYLGELMVRLPRKPLPPQHRWTVAAPEQVDAPPSRYTSPITTGAGFTDRFA
jgi:hypothetical protein